MQWHNTESLFEEDKQTDSLENNKLDNMIFKQEEYKSFQLFKFQDPRNNVNRQPYLSLLAKFNNFSSNEKLEETAQEILTKDCSIFLFNSKWVKSAKYSKGQKEFIDAYRGLKIKKREVRETNIDVEKSTAIQICIYQISEEESNFTTEELGFEIFTIQENKISKYRASFACVKPEHGPGDPLQTIRKDLMLAKVKEINYALSDQPDLEKIASLFHESTEYKIWGWDTQKCFVFNKQNLVKDFHNLEEHIGLKCIVPYEMFTEEEYVVGTYVYHLEGKLVSAGKKFVWLTRCIYLFDRDINLVKVSQQGELYPEEEVTIPFEIYTRERIKQKVGDLLNDFKPNLDVFYHDRVNFDCRFCRYGPPTLPFMGNYMGYNHIDKIFMKLSPQSVKLEWIKAIDYFIDPCDQSYDVVILAVCGQGALCFAEYKNQGKRINFCGLIKMYFENGKLAKILQVLQDIPEPIPSPFDDSCFEAQNIKKWEDFDKNESCMK